MNNTDKIQNSSPKRILIPFNLSAEEALKALKVHLGIGKETEGNSDWNEIEKNKSIK